MSNIRYFRNSQPDGAGQSIFPDGLVRIVDGHRADRRCVEYLEPPPGFAGHRFHVTDGELMRVESPLFDVGSLWVITIPSLPTFYLNGTVQGIVDAEHAAKIAASITAYPVTAAHVDRLVDILY